LARHDFVVGFSDYETQWRGYVRAQGSAAGVRIFAFGFVSPAPLPFPGRWSSAHSSEPDA